MNTIIIHGDGMAGLPSAEAHHKTPLELASTPTLDMIATQGEFGTVKPLAETPLFAGDVTHLALLGYDPKKYYSGPGPFVGAGLEVVLGSQDVAFICSLVTLGPSTSRGDGKKIGTHVVLEDDTAGGISTEEARELIDVVNEQLGSEGIQFYTGTGHRHLMVWVGGVTRMACHDPHFVVGHEVGAFLPTGEGAEIINELMEAARTILQTHPVNKDRERAGIKPANGLWIWGPGQATEFPLLKDRIGITGATISSADLHLGVSRRAGMACVNIENQKESTNQSLAIYAAEALKLCQQVPLVYVHIQEQADPVDSYWNEKVRRIELFDQEVIAPILTGLMGLGDFRLLVVCNPWAGGSGGAMSVHTPYALLEGGKAQKKTVPVLFSEPAASASTGGAKEATSFLERWFPKASR